MPKSSSSVGAISAKMPSCSFGLPADTIKNGTGLVVCAVYGWLVPPSYIFSRLPWSAVMQTAPPSASTFFTILPAAKSGVVAAIVLGIGRAIGETMAVIMIAGNHAVMPDSLLAGVRTLTSNIVLELGYATDLHREALIATGVVLFVFILIINLLFSVVKKKGAK